MLQLIAKFFGTKSEKDIKRVRPLVEATKQEGERMKSLSHDELRGQTQEVQSTINERLKPIDAEIAGLHKQVNDQPDLDLHEKEAIFLQVDKLELDRNKELESVLIEVLPKAFAIMR